MDGLLEGYAVEGFFDEMFEEGGGVRPHYRALQERVAAMIATHNLEIARRMDRAVTIQDGVLVAA